MKLVPGLILYMKVLFQSPSLPPLSHFAVSQLYTPIKNCKHTYTLHTICANHAVAMEWYFMNLFRLIRKIVLPSLLAPYSKGNNLLSNSCKISILHSPYFFAGISVTTPEIGSLLLRGKLPSWGTTTSSIHFLLYRDNTRTV